MTVIEQVKRLTEKHCEFDWEEDDLSTLHAALPDLLKLARLAYDDHLRLPWHPDPCETCDALMRLFHGEEKP